ncbi:polycomb protein Sfmbt isoform X2 [Aethina tumida]|uniref:polycomb protein Sfmbt isoform X2 n=1 Tax=Aethina tumida TaxID=116153 RepID=UPI00096B3C4F|nr:polycomb protein Sfmbt isoform X2 [Aethina tumida]
MLNPKPDRTQSPTNMNVFNTMPTVADMGMVWMGSGPATSDIPMGMMANDHGDMMLDHENIYYTPSHHSMSSQSMDDMNTIHSSSHLTDSMENYEMMNFIDMKHESSDSNFAEDENSQPVYMITTSTQTLPFPTRKIKPVKHPGLVLKTPIAYQSNTDPSVIPIQKDGIAVCEKCGAIGVKHAFYTRERRFCSMACARGYSGLIPEPLPQSNQNTPDTKQHFAKYRFTQKTEDDYTDAEVQEPVPQLIPPPVDPPVDDSLPLIRRKLAGLANSFDWDSQLNDQYFVAAPVTCFKHAPMSDIWENIMVGMKVEVENTDCDDISDTFPDSFWVATVMKIVGYKAQLRYEGFGSNDSKDFWVTLCSNMVHPVGWCATRGKPLIPPRTIQDKYSDWKDFLRKRLTGARTLPSNYSTKASDSQRSRFEVGLNLEVVDKNRISQVKVAIVHKIVGKRLNVKYFDLPQDDAGFWCHEDSPLLHPVGWAKKVGHHIVAPVEYMERINQGLYDEYDATEELFTPFQVGSRDHVAAAGFCIGMKLEAIDPLNLSSICVATVMDVLRFGYIMIRIDTYDSDATGADWFCYHVKSPCIFPVGFCERSGIPLTPPMGYGQALFNWTQYLRDTNNEAAEPSCFNNYVPLHGFVAGMKIEAADLMDPRLVCVATVAKVAGRILKVHFDGWEDEYDQWLDCESPDIYPVGWCQSVGHKLEGPPAQPKPSSQVKTPKGIKKKGKKKKTKEMKSTSSNTVIKLMKPDESIADQSVTNTTISSSSGVGGGAMTSGMSVITTTTEDVTVKEEASDDNAGPETGEEPAAPVLNQPIASDVVDPPHERKVNTNGNTSTKYIPRLVDTSGGTNESGKLVPDEWNVFDVAQFLRVNECANYCDAFTKQKVDGKSLMNLNKEDILEYTGGKVGPSLKIYDLIQQLKIKVNPSQLRHMKVNNIKKFL